MTLHLRQSGGGGGGGCSSKDAGTKLPSAPQGHTTTEAPRDEHYVECKRLLRGRSTGFQGQNYLQDSAMKLWVEASLVLHGPNQGLHQSLAKDLVNDEFKGFEYIKATIEMRGAHGNNIRCAQSFLAVITHPSLLDPLSIDSFVSTLYHFFAGHDGGKAVKFLLELSQALKTYYEGRLDHPLTTTTPLMLILRTLAEVLEREARSRLNEDVVTLFDKIDAVAAPLKNHPIMNEITMRIGLLRRLVSRETDRLAATKVGGMPDTTTRPVQSTFPTKMALPGGRHDNDFPDISAVQILPTRGEIDSGATECLPSTDFTRPHYLEDPVQRHLDCAFRLLRHDIFGPVKKVLNDLLAQDLSAGQKPRLSGDANAHLYLDAKVGELFVEKGSLGAVVCFRSPPHLRYKSANERRDW